MCEPDFVR